MPYLFTEDYRRQVLPIGILQAHNQGGTAAPGWPAIRAMHAEFIAEHGGRAEIRDAGLLSSALARPPNRRACGTSPALFDLAAMYGVAIVKNHPFVDGNKRVALRVMYVFLEINGYRLDAPEVEAADFMICLAAGERPCFAEKRLKTDRAWQANLRLPCF